MRWKSLPAATLGLALATAAAPTLLDAGEPPGDGGHAAQPAPETPESADHWQPWSYFLGEWKGEEKGVFGDGHGERTYERILGDRFLLARNRSTFPPQEGLPAGDVHEDWAIFSYDQARDTFVLRQFVSEGHVNRYVLDPSSDPPRRRVFVSEASENAPPGFRLRLTYEIVGDDEFTESFEMAPPGAELRVVLRNRWRRVGVGR